MKGGNPGSSSSGQKPPSATPVANLPDDLTEVARGFQASRILLTAIELDLFSVVDRVAGTGQRRADPGGQRGAAAADVAGLLATDVRATETLMNALTALGYLEKEGDRFDNSPTARRFLSDQGEEFARPALMHTVHLWPRWSTLTDCVRAGTSVTYKEMDQRGDEWTEPFIAAMHRNASARAAAVVRAVDVSQVRRMLDVGGGSGAYSIAFAQARPDLQAEVLDLATVTPIADRHIQEAGLLGRVTTRVGDLSSDEFGTGYDLVFVSAICHMLGPDENKDLLRRCRNALSPGGRVVVQDFILHPDKAAPRQAALFAINMLVSTRAGSSYSEQEYTDWMAEAGLTDVRRIELPGPSDLITGTRPES